MTADLNDFHFEFPPEQIAVRHPGKGKTRILKVPLEGGDFSEMPATALVDVFHPGDCLVVNNTRVIPARLLGRKDTGGHVEVLLISPEPSDRGSRWRAMVKPGRAFTRGAAVRFGQFRCFVEEILRDGLRILTFDLEPEPFREWLEREGHVPLPPYIRRPADQQDREDYQTVFARVSGAVAAPTASLHFNEEMLQALRDKGVHIAEVTLHVGPGTFQNIQENDYTKHRMHTEKFEVHPEQADLINRCRRGGGRIVCVGTTTTRVLETVARADGEIVPSSGETDLFIYPGYRFKVVQGLITNFHWPKSSLILLVSALTGRERLLDAYRDAIRRGFLLFSYGDGMLIL